MAALEVKLVVSIVLYAPDMEVIQDVLQSLEQAVSYAKKHHKLTLNLKINKGEGFFRCHVYLRKLGYTLYHRKSE